MHSMRIELAKLILLVGTRITYQATGDMSHNLPCSMCAQ